LNESLVFALKWGRGDREVLRPKVVKTLEERGSSG